MEETRHIRQFSEISGVRRNPGAVENNKFPRFNNTTGKFDYVCVGDGGASDINLSYFTTLINNTVGPNTDDYLTTVYQSQTGSANSSFWAGFQMKSSPTKFLKLGRLAWLDEFETPNLPGDQKLLFDENNTIGGRDNLKYNYTSSQLLLTNTPLHFRITGESTYKEGVKYLGGFSFSVGGGMVSAKTGMYNILSGYKAGHNLRSSSEYNTIYGPHAGEYTSTALKNSIFIGAHAGKYESSDNKLYIDNVDYLTEEDAQNESFLYAELSTEKRLYIRNRFAVTKEGKFGDSELSNEDGEAGMFQMVADGPLVKPQWHDSVEWQDFAAGQNHYLQEISEDLSTEGLYHFLIKDSTGTTTIEDLTLQLPILEDVEVPVAYTPSYPNITAADYGYIQISNSSLSINKGFYFKSDFRWNNTLSELNIPGGVKLATRSPYLASAGVIRWDANLGHFYGMVGTTWKQLDNSEFEEITAINIGGASYEWFKQKNTDGELELRTIQSMEIDEVLNPRDRITFKYSATGDAILVGTTAERNRLSTTIDDETVDRMIDKTNEGETLHIRALREGENIVLTQTEHYIKIDAVTGGAATLMDGANLGTYDWFAQRNGTNLEFYGIDTADTRISITQANGTTTFDNDLSLNLNITGYNYPNASGADYYARVYEQTIDGDGDEPTLYFRPLISDSISLEVTENNEIRLEISGYSTINVGTGYELFVTGGGTTNEFRTLQQLKHLQISQEATEIFFDVDDITLTNIGSGTYLIEQDTEDSFNFTQIGIVGTNGLSIDVDTVEDNVVLTIPNIEKFELVSGDFVKSTTFSGTPVVFAGTPSGTLSFKLNHDDVINDGTPSYITRIIAEIKLGGGLRFDDVNNVLWNSSDLSNIVDTNHYLQKITTDSETDPSKIIYTFEVQDSMGNYPTNYMGEYYPLTIEVPKTLLNVAEYTDSEYSSGVIGGVKVEEYAADWVIQDTVPLALDVITGTISANKYIVTYETQNYLHDEHNEGEVLNVPPDLKYNINELRANARANIGSAYVNGSEEEDFNADNLNAVSKLTAASIEDTHQLGSVLVSDNVIESSGSKDLKLRKTGDTGYGESSNIVLKDGNIEIKMGNVPFGVKQVIFLNEANTKIMILDNSGNLYVKGKIFADSDIEAFTDDITV